ncbi:hypothetical protein Q4Q39_16885 [Flavivirga amylovorans]|uniref:Uncharacterized protein n=1 Tax=Flavivirga amylovorans TaxID=870486 RepID=A0ABT8X5G0_9FLAO|nr:hypothetical protein [Flavivirga amylovorans]MDO5989082.1 hypothetical protein [Flavivirga amylovorans]
MKKVILIVLCLLFFRNNIHAQKEIPTKAINGTYHLLVPARDGSKKQFLQVGENNGVKILVMASCEQCIPATYMYNAKASNDVGKPVYGKSGIYVITYDANSYISVMPKSPMVALGEGVWGTFAYYNFFSTDKNKVTAMTKDKVEAYAIKFSEDIINGTKDINVAGGNGEFFAVSKLKHAGEYYKSVQVEFVESGEKQIKMLVSSGYSVGTYYFLPEYSKLLGFDVYGDRGNLREYIFSENNIAFIWAKFRGSGELGQETWGEYDVFNYFHKDQQTIRKLDLDKSKQEDIGTKLLVWTKKAKVYGDKKYSDKQTEKIKNERLPKKGLQNLSLEAQALVASKNWANQYGWQETITKVYFTDTDWSIYRNSLTGAQLGRRISGVIVMKRKDGRCSYHYAVFAQQCNGSGYQKVFTEGITPGQNILECKYVN